MDRRPADEAASSKPLEQPAGNKFRLLRVTRNVLTWMPKRVRYDAENPPKFTMALNLLFAIATTFTVSNLYYNQPILNQMAVTFGVTFEKASSVATLMQAGYAAGLLFICPLGDIFRRRYLILGLVLFTAVLVSRLSCRLLCPHSHLLTTTAQWIALCLTTDFAAFAAISFICGATTVTPQLMLPLVGDLAPAKRRATALSIVVSGLVLGMLVARVLSGVVANYTDWRNIYWFAFGIQFVILGLLFFFMPDYPSKNPGGLNYLAMLWSIGYMLFTEPLLAQACLISFSISAVFTSYWTTLSFLLSSPPYSYSSVDIGLFGLIGIVVISLGPVYSILIIDKMVPLLSTLLGLLVEIIGVAVGTFIGDFTIAGPIIQAITIDTGNQFAQIANRASIYTIQPNARNRVNTAYMLSAFIGQLTGTAVGNRLYAEGGWRYSGACSSKFFHCTGARWLGWRADLEKLDFLASPSWYASLAGPENRGGLAGRADGAFVETT
jgi:predicted MFS family arabinose efflux permease